MAKYLPLWCLLLLLNLPIPLTQAAAAKEAQQKAIYIYRLEPILQQNHLYFNAQTRIQLPERVKQALLHEIPLTFVIQIEVRQPKSLLGLDLSETLYQLQFKTTLQYYNFNQTFILMNQRNKKVKLFNQLDPALETLGTFEKFSIMPITPPLKPNTQLRLRIYLERWQLPAPLLLETLYNSDWQLNSDWVEQTL